MARATSTAAVTVTGSAPTTTRATSSATVNVSSLNTTRALSTGVITVTNPNAGLWVLRSGVWKRAEALVRRAGSWLSLGAAGTGTTPPPPTAMPVGNLTGWTQTYTQDFTTPASVGSAFATTYGADMVGYVNVTDTSGNGLYDPASVLSARTDVANANGVLDWHLHTSGGVHRVACPIPMGYTGQTYGRYSVRMRSDTMPGYKIAFMLWPVSDDWNDGEVDYPEGETGQAMRPANAVPGSAATYAYTDVDWDPSWSTTTYAPANSTDWHTYTTEWTPTAVRWYFDGSLLHQTTNTASIPTTPFRWTLQVETSIETVPADTVQGHVQVDWIVAYEMAV